MRVVINSILLINITQAIWTISYDTAHTVWAIRYGQNDGPFDIRTLVVEGELKVRGDLVQFMIFLNSSEKTDPRKSVVDLTESVEQSETVFKTNFHPEFKEKVCLNRI